MYDKLLTGKKYMRFTGSLMISSILKLAKDPIDNFSQSSGETLLNSKLSSVWCLIIPKQISCIYLFQLIINELFKLPKLSQFSDSFSLSKQSNEVEVSLR